MKHETDLNAGEYPPNIEETRERLVGALLTLAHHHKQRTLLYERGLADILNRLEEKSATVEELLQRFQVGLDLFEWVDASLTELKWPITFLTPHINIFRLATRWLDTYGRPWVRDCEIIPDYLPPYARAPDKPKCVVRHKPLDVFIRFSGGPVQHYFWDVYGDNFITPELALIALSQAPAPRPCHVEVRLPIKTTCSFCEARSKNIKIPPCPVHQPDQEHAYYQAVAKEEFLPDIDEPTFHALRDWYQMRKAKAVTEKGLT